MTHELIAIALGVLAGTLSALFGVGGGIIFVPTLIFLGHSAHVAVATSLAAMVPVIAVGAWRQTRYGSVNWHDALIIGVASVPMTKVGEIVATSLANDTLRRVFALLLVLVAVQLALRVLRPPAGETAVPDANVSRRRPAETPVPGTSVSGRCAVKHRCLMPMFHAARPVPRSRRGPAWALRPTARIRWSGHGRSARVR